MMSLGLATCFIVLVLHVFADTIQTDADSRALLYGKRTTPAPAGLQFSSAACPTGSTSYVSNAVAFTICPMSDYVGPSTKVTREVASTNACADLCGQTKTCQRAIWDKVKKNCHFKAEVETLALIVDPSFDSITVTSQLFRLEPAKAGTTVVYGICGVNAQHMFLGTDETVFIVDRVEANPLLVPSRSGPAYAAAFSLSDRTCMGMPTISNAFCTAGGTVSDGDWVSGGGSAPRANTTGTTSGFRALRKLKACDDNSCQWQETSMPALHVKRWYPSAETMGDGSLILMGGFSHGTFMPFPKTGNEPTAEYYPSKGAPVPMPVLDRGWPFSLYPFTAVLSDGRILVVSGTASAIWDPKTQAEVELPSKPNGPGSYPSGAANVLLPLTPQNGYKETMMVCGGASDKIVWPTGPGCPPSGTYAVEAMGTCDRITPLAARPAWTPAANMPSLRTMGNLILLPDNTIALVNGVKAGTEGYGCGGPGDSMATDPNYAAYVYDPQKDAWSALATQIVNRGYHSSATLLPDGSILAAGSSPHDDAQPLVQPFPTEYRLEKIYPKYFDNPRPTNEGVPTRFPYGGQAFSITLRSVGEANGAFVRLIRTGWSTHALQMGQRSYELQRTVKGRVVTFSGLPNNPNVFPPGAALAFLVVNGIPATGKMSIVGPGT